MVRIVIDSASDIELEKAKELKLDFMPLKTIFGEDEYLDGVTITHEQFFEKLIECGTMPTTSQISPYDFEKKFEEIKAAGDTAVVITLSSLLSGTYQSATIAASEIAAELEEAKHHIKVLAVFDTLEYLKRGGRISKTAAWAGNVLSIKPVISIEKGEVAILGKARGSKNGNNMLIQQINQSNGIDFSMPYSLAYSGLSDVLLQKYVKDSSAIWEGHTDTLPVSTIGATIGTHAGPGAIAVSYFECK